LVVSSDWPSVTEKVILSEKASTMSARVSLVSVQLSAMKWVAEFGPPSAMPWGME
jgi:hypothetical protein